MFKQKTGIGVGVGRPLDDHWMVRFRRAFKEVAPPDVKFKSRRIPGLLYVSSLELEEALDGRFSKYTPESVIRKRVRNYVGALCMERELEAGANRHLTVTGLHLERHNSDPRNEHTNIELRIFDQSEQGITLSERNVVRNAFMCLPIQGDSRYRVLLGSVNRSPEVVTNRLLEGVFEQLGPYVQLDPVGVVLR
jgi:hypothetical protein